MAWNEMLKADAAAIVTDAFGPFEAATLWPLGVAGGARAIRVAMMRADFQPIPESNNANVMMAQVMVPNHATHGVTSWTLNRDKLVCVMRLGSAAVPTTVRTIIAQTPAFWHVEVQA